MNVHAVPTSIVSLALGTHAAFAFSGGMLLGLAIYMVKQHGSFARLQAQLPTAAASGGAR